MRIATIGTGKIVEKFISAVGDVENAQWVAVYSRKEETGRAFANQWGISKVYTDFDRMLQEDEINFIYIASPNSLHYHYALRALERGKHVICEKPFTSTLAETEALIHLAKANQLFLFEAITTIHLPNFQLIKAHLPKVGQLRMVMCNYSQLSSRYGQLLAGESPNVFNPQYSGGALLDINIYNLHFVINLFGRPQSVRYTANQHANGIDTSGVVVLQYPDFICHCTGSKDAESENFVYIQGEKGYIHVKRGANGCREFSLHANGEKLVINEQPHDNLLFYEVRNFAQLYHQRDYEACYRLLDHSRLVMEVAEAARKDAGIRFPADQW